MNNHDNTSNTSSTTSGSNKTASIGKLFDHHEKCEIVACSAKFAFQHDLVNWQVLGNDFIYKNSVSQDSMYVENFIKKTLGELSLEEKEDFVNATFNLAYSTGAKTLTELSKNKMKLLSQIMKLNRDDKHILRRILFGKILKDHKVRRIIFSSLRRGKEPSNN